MFDKEEDSLGRVAGKQTPNESSASVGGSFSQDAMLPWGSSPGGLQQYNQGQRLSLSGHLCIS